MWVARDKNGTVWLYTNKPIRSSMFSRWNVDTENSLFSTNEWMEIDGDLFPDLKWEDEPIEVELIKKSNETGR